MFIDSLTFVENIGTDKKWAFRDVHFNKINLIVGKNSTGKSRMLNVVASLGGFVAGEKNILGNDRLEAFFKDDGENLKYVLEFQDSKVTKEILSINNDTLLDRGQGGIGKIYAEKQKAMMDFQVPETSLACVARRDSIQHSYFEPLFNWGKSIRHYTFGSDMGKNSFAIFLKDGENKPINFKDFNQVVVFFKKGIDKKGDDFKKAILKDINGIGYNIDDIKVAPADRIRFDPPPPAPPECLFIKEEGLDIYIDQSKMSQGLFRALSLFINLRFSELFSEPSLVLIDDIGEGLDFERSKYLINSIISIVKATNIQLIMATNDRFVMNNVPLEHWSILLREGGECHVLNYKNSKDIFDKFAFTGLNNFDFFSSKYYERDLEKND